MTIRGANPNKVQRRTTDITVHCASPLRAEVPVLRILAATPCPHEATTDAQRDLYVREGEQLAEAIVTHLPGGTVDQLLAALLLRRASLLRVRL